MSPPSDGGDTPFRYNLELTPSQLKVTHDVLRAALDAGEQSPEVAALMAEVLAKLPDAAQVGSIRLAQTSAEPPEEPADEPPTELVGEPPAEPDDEPPDVVA